MMGNGISTEVKADPARAPEPPSADAHDLALPRDSVRVCIPTIESHPNQFINGVLRPLDLRRGLQTGTIPMEYLRHYRWWRVLVAEDRTSIDPDTWFVNVMERYIIYMPQRQFLMGNPGVLQRLIRYMQENSHISEDHILAYFQNCLVYETRLRAVEEALCSGFCVNPYNPLQGHK